MGGTRRKRGGRTMIVLDNMIIIEPLLINRCCCEQILRRIDMEGERLQRPRSCPKRLFEEVVRTCWSLKPQDRPRFEALCKTLVDVSEM